MWQLLKKKKIMESFAKIIKNKQNVTSKDFKKIRSHLFYSG